MAAGVLASGPGEQMARWAAEVRPKLEAVGLQAPAMASAVPTAGGRDGCHTQALAGLLDETTSVWRVDPQARG